jgi:hypothetical protein
MEHTDRERLDWLESQMRNYGDGHTEPKEVSFGYIGWQQSKEQPEYPGLRELIDQNIDEFDRAIEGLF